jgi:phosphoribosylformylglycinamidine cyclo-ligase
MVESAFPHVKGLAHITGGGMLKNVPRILPKGLAAKINRSACRVPPIFKLIQKTGDVPEEEMWRVFNMGIGMVIVCSPEKMREVRRLLPEAIGVGEIVRKEGEQGVVFS